MTPVTPATNARRPAAPAASPAHSAVGVLSPARRAFSFLYVIPLAVLLSPLLLGPLVGRLRAIR
jgi:hypothetical protein